MNIQKLLLIALLSLNVSYCSATDKNKGDSKASTPDSGDSKSGNTPLASAASADTELACVQRIVELVLTSQGVKCKDLVERIARNNCEIVELCNKTNLSPLQADQVAGKVKNLLGQNTLITTGCGDVAKGLTSERSKKDLSDLENQLKQLSRYGQNSSSKQDLVGEFPFPRLLGKVEGDPNNKARVTKESSSRGVTYSINRLDSGDYVSYPVLKINPSENPDYNLQACTEFRRKYRSSLSTSRFGNPRRLDDEYFGW